jgi:hypothetical protein
MMKKTTTAGIAFNLLFLFYAAYSYGQINSSSVYWVGHSLVDGKNWMDPYSRNLIELFGYLSEEAGKTSTHHRHITPGAPLGWNWGNATSWADMAPKLDPLINTSNALYGTFDVMVITEGVNLESTYNAWHPAFYARKFFNAARRANSSTRLFLYESWHHYNAGDFQSFYGPQATFDWHAYMSSMRTLWETIADEASTEATAVPHPEYVYQGPGEDPGNGSDDFIINIVPTGKVLMAALNRLAENRPGDDWTFNNGTPEQRLRDVDFFYNPYLNFPEDLTTTVHSGQHDDIHASDVLSYLNALTHYAVIYKESPDGLPGSYYVPQNIADIFQEIVWEVVINDPRSGVEGVPLSLKEKNTYKNFHNGLAQSDEPMPYKIYNINGMQVHEGIGRTVETPAHLHGIYIVVWGEQRLKIYLP